MLVRRHTRDEKSGLVNKLGALPLPLPLRVNGIDYRALSISITGYVAQSTSYQT